jgi:hypothetical protein
MLTEAIKEARGWLEDCDAPDVVGRSDLNVIRTVHAHCDGGWPAFISADPTMDEAVVWLLMVRKFGIDVANEMFPSKP